MMALLAGGCASPQRVVSSKPKSELSIEQRGVLRNKVIQHLKNHGVPIVEKDFHYESISPVQISTEGKCKLYLIANREGDTYCNLSNLDFVVDLPVPLESINVCGTKVSDLSALADTDVLEAAASYTQVSDISVFKGKPMRGLCFCNTPITDISIVKGMPLTHALFSSTGISDISPLKGAPLIQLEIRETNVTDLSPLAGMKIQFIGLPPLHQITKGLEAVRSMQSLKVINRRTPSSFWKRAGEDGMSD